MIKKIIVLIIIINFSVLGFLFAQQRSFLDRHATMKGLNCSACHDCINPSLSDPCLKLGPHFFHGEGIKLKSDERPPELIIIDKLGDQYGPVKFKHRNHMHMAERIEDCAECHHYIPPDLPKKACETCHVVNVPEEQLETLSLNAVLHRKCLGCHVEWGKSTNCEHCHISRDREEAEKLGKELPTYRDAEKPEQIRYVTYFFSGPYVKFSHKDHEQKKNVICADCHVKQPCVSCHYQEAAPANMSVLARTGVHGTCRFCHDVVNKEKCMQCHKDTEQLEKVATKK